MPVLPLAHHVAEKVHAYTRTYGEQGMSSTRVKDLVDLVLIASTESLDASALRQALERTFASRATHPLPLSLPLPPPEWAIPFAKTAADVEIDHDVMAGHRAAARLVDPVLAESTPLGTHWDSASQTWNMP